jgi:hypothetical protein
MKLCCVCVQVKASDLALKPNAIMAKTEEIGIEISVLILYDVYICQVGLLSEFEP